MRRAMKNMSKCVVLEMNNENDGFYFDSSIQEAIQQAQLEVDKLDETIHSIQFLRAECDRVDYSLAIASGALSGLIDIFLVGQPGNSILGKMTDKWFEKRIMDFAKFCGWNREKNHAASSAIRFLERKFKVPYDQHGAGDTGQRIFNLTPTNHHFKSLGHNPSLLGLFFSILDQFTNQAHFITEGELISLQKADDGYELRGGNVLSKLFCGFVNWFGHLMSDISGSSGGKGRGMGIPSPLWTWVNDIIVIKQQIGITPSNFDKVLNELAIKLYTSGYDARFQSTQIIPVLINEFVTRFFYSVRRLMKYLVDTTKGEYSFQALWKSCEPFSNPTIKRMILVAHGTFCLIDVGEALACGAIAGGGIIAPFELLMKLNIIGVGRFTISIYSETKRTIQNWSIQQSLHHVRRERFILESYLESLTRVNTYYEDEHLMGFIRDFSSSEVYMDAFRSSVKLAEKRNVPREKILHSKQEGDAYFRGENN